MNNIRGKRNERQYGRTGIVTGLLLIVDKEREDEDISLHINTDVSSHLE